MKAQTTDGLGIDSSARALQSMQWNCSLAIRERAILCFVNRYFTIWGVLVLLNFTHFSRERSETGSLGGTKSEVWIGIFNVKAWKTTTKSGAH